MASGPMVMQRAERTGGGYNVRSGDTLSAALCALLANGSDLSEAFTESLSYLDRCLEAGVRPGMGHIVPDRLFWAQPELEPQEDSEQNPFPPSISNLESHPNDTKH